MKFFILVILLISSTLYSMKCENPQRRLIQQRYQSKSLVTLCVETITDTIEKECLNEYLPLAKKITIKFPIPKDDCQIDKNDILKKLIHMTTISHETDLFIISPISITIKNLPEDLLEKLQVNLEKTTTLILPNLYKIQGSIVQCFTDLVVRNLRNNHRWQEDDLFKKAPAPLLNFINKRLDIIHSQEAQWLNWCP